MGGLDENVVQPGQGHQHVLPGGRAPGPVQPLPGGVVYQYLVSVACGTNLDWVGEVDKTYVITLDTIISIYFV